MKKTSGHILFLLAGWFFLMLMSSGLQAENAIEKLVSPGPVSTAHEKLEKDCTTCHQAFSREAQSFLCADCHKDVKSDVAKKQGYHGKSFLVSKSECSFCHTEHRGRDFNQVRMNTLLFNHDETDFKLDGSHAKVACDGCHAKGKKFRDAKSSCFECHNKDQPHFGRLGNQCEKCHNTTTWVKTTPFDHDKTKFQLRGAHTKVSCLSCHVGEIYKDVSTSCKACHAIQDVHLGRFKEECSQCHSVENWKQAKFDHTKFTKFPLLGAHAKATCTDCHGANHTSKISMACFDCHAKQDAHKGQLGKDCGTCHGTQAWRDDVKFDHGLTSYPLTGMHAVVACENCHKSPAFKDAPTACYSCHQKDDTHQGRLTTKCESCHSTASWKRISFNHDTDTRFKLTGAHSAVGCHGCHKQQNVTTAKLPMGCIDCHRKDDVHKGAFGPNCASCHGTSTFKNARIAK
jgi:hypothetical protein